MNEVIRWLRRSRAFSTNARAHLRMLLKCRRDDYRRQQQEAMHGGTETANGKTRESSLTSGEVSTIMPVCKKCMQVHVGWRIRTAKQHLQRVQNIAAIEVSCYQDFRGSFCELNLSTCGPLILPPLTGGARAVEATGRLLELLRKHFWR